MMRRIITLCLTIAVLAAMTACNPLEISSRVKSISLNQTSVTIKEGEIIRLIPTVTPDNAKNNKVKWTSSDSSIASVDDKGDVEGLKSYIENDPKAYNPDGSLHIHLQEAVLVYSEEDETYCREHGVTDGTFNRYQSFKRKFLELGASNGNPIRDMKSFSDTFWYYFMFKKI